MTKREIAWWANRKASEIESIEFRADFPGGITGALRIMEIGNLYYWDADDCNRISFHVIARRLGIRVATLKCKYVSAYLITRIE